MTSLSFDELFEEENQDFNPESFHSFDLVDEEDKLIIMHRDAHFSGSFKWMLNYYLEDGVGVDLDISIKRIEELALIEEKQGSNLAPTLLSGRDAERIALVKKAYANLKEICENSRKDSPAKLLADLILSEEEDPKEEIEALSALGLTVVPILIQSLNSETFLDPMGPGYGLASVRILEVLSRIKDPSISKELFSMLSRDLFEDEGLIFNCLHSIGNEASNFLIQVLESCPFSEDNTKAAYVLISFQNETCSKACLNFLEAHLSITPMTVTLLSYTILACESLGSKEKERFLALKDRIPKSALADYQLIVSSLS